MPMLRSTATAPPFSEDAKKACVVPHSNLHAHLYMKTMVAVNVIVNVNVTIGSGMLYQVAASHNSHARQWRKGYSKRHSALHYSVEYMYVWLFPFPKVVVALTSIVYLKVS